MSDSTSQRRELSWRRLDHPVPALSTQKFSPCPSPAHNPVPAPPLFSGQPSPLREGRIQDRELRDGVEQEEGDQSSRNEPIIYAIAVESTPMDAIKQRRMSLMRGDATQRSSMICGRRSSYNLNSSGSTFRILKLNDPAIQSLSTVHNHSLRKGSPTLPDRPSSPRWSARGSFSATELPTSQQRSVAAHGSMPHSLNANAPLHRAAGGSQGTSPASSFQFPHEETLPSNESVTSGSYRNSSLVANSRPHSRPSSRSHSHLLSHAAQSTSAGGFPIANVSISSNSPLGACPQQQPLSGRVGISDDPHSSRSLHSVRKNPSPPSISIDRIETPSPPSPIPIHYVSPDTNRARARPMTSGGASGRGLNHRATDSNSFLFSSPAASPKSERRKVSLSEPSLVNSMVSSSHAPAEEVVRRGKVGMEAGGGGDALGEARRLGAGSTIAQPPQKTVGSREAEVVKRTQSNVVVGVPASGPKAPSKSFGEYSRRRK